MKRAAETLLQQYLQSFPCVAIVGVRQCGKTTLLHTLDERWRHFDLERQADAALLASDPDTFLRLNPRHITIDEVQLAPGIFPALRVAIDDARGEKGRFVLSGSSSPELLRAVSESLAGRVGIIELSPFSWEEVTGTSERDSFLRRLPDRRATPHELIDGLTPRGDIRLAHDFWFRGGFPEPWLTGDPAFRTRWTDQYLRSYLQRDVRQLFPRLDDVRFRRFLEMLGGLSGRVLNYAEIGRALNLSQPTVRDYFEIAHGTFVWRQVPAHARDTVRRTVRHARGYLRDSGLLHTLLRIPDLDALLAHPQMGASWEGMVIEEILRQLHAQGVPCDYSYYRTSAGAEVDLVIDGDFGAVAVEIKHTSAVEPRRLQALRRFVAERGARLGVVVSNDVAPRLLDDAIVGVPFQYL